MGMRLRHRDPMVQGTGAAQAARPTRGSSIARTLRTAWWPRFASAGLVITIVGVTLLSGTAQALVALGGAVVFLAAAVIGLGGKGWDRDSRNQPPMPPGGGGVPFGG
jgi:hypothetical protein